MPSTLQHAAESGSHSYHDVTGDSDLSRPDNTLPTLFDTLILQRASSIFFDYLREVSSIYERISDPSLRSTLFVPSNKAVIALGWKPERGPPPPGQSGGIEITEDTLEDNVKKWVSAHIVPGMDVDFESPKTHNTLLSGKVITFKRLGTESTEGAEDWKNYGIVQGDREFLPLKTRIEASNGVVYLIDGTISLD